MTTPLENLNHFDAMMDADEGRVFPDLRGKDSVLIACSKCAGTGIYTGFSQITFYTEKAGFETTGCFQCDGFGEERVKVSNLRARVKRARDKRAQRKAERAEREAAEEARWQEQQRQREEERKNATPITEGRQLVEGELVAIKSEKSHYGYGGVTIVKCLVKREDGSRIWGTLPTAILDACKGDVIRYTATVTASKSDETFGFAKRPSKAEIVIRHEWDDEDEE